MLSLLSKNTHNKTSGINYFSAAFILRLKLAASLADDEMNNRQKLLFSVLFFSHIKILSAKPYRLLGLEALEGKIYYGTSSLDTAVCAEFFFTSVFLKRQEEYERLIFCENALTRISNETF